MHSPYRERYLRAAQTFTAEFAAQVTSEAGFTAYCDSTPSNILIAQELSDALPNARFILVLRHYSGVLQSLERSYASGYEWAGATIAERAILWSSHYAHAAHLPPERTIAISYDAVCHDPGSTISEFRAELTQLALGEVSLDLSVLATSHATHTPRPTIGQKGPNGETLLRSMPSFDAKAWNSVEQAVADTYVHVIDNALELLFGSRYAAPTSEMADQRNLHQ